MKSTLARPFGSGRLLNAAAMVTGSTHISYLLSFVTSALIARYIGPADFGRYSYFVWLCGLLIMVANNGLTTTGIRYVAQSLGRGANDDASRVHGRLSRLQWWSLLATLLVFAGVLPLVQPSGWANNLAWFGVLVALAVIAKTRYLFDVSIAKGYGAFDVEARTTVVLALITTVATLALCVAGAGLDVFLITFALAGIGHMLLAAGLLRRRTQPASTLPLAADMTATMHRHLFWTVVLAVTAAFSARSMETFLLNSVVGPREVGFFAIALALTRGGTELICAGPNAVLMPAMGHAFGEGGIPRVHSILSASLRHFTLLGLLLAGGGVFCAQAAITLMYGPSYQPAVDVFRVLVVVAGLTLPMGSLGALLSTTDHQKLRAGVSVFSLLVSAVAALALVPRLGLTGAMISSALSALVVYAVVLLACVITLKIRIPVGPLLRQYLAALIAAGVCVAGLNQLDAAGATAQAIAGLGFGVLMMAGTLALGAWPLEDIEVLRGLAQRWSTASGWLLPPIDRWIERTRRRAAS